MALSELIKKKNIIIGSPAKNRWDIISEMLDVAAKNNDLSNEDIEEIESSLIEREKTMSTGIGKGVAIPHCTSVLVNDTIIVISLSEKGIDFDSIDGEPVKIVIMLIVPKSKLTQHIKTLANIAKLMSDDKIKDKMLTLKTPDSIYKLIKDSETTKK